MLAGALVALVLLLTLLVRRSGAPTRLAIPAWQTPRSRQALWLGALLSLATSLPIWRLAPWLSGNPPAFWGDDRTHAQVAAEIVAHGLPHGWIDGYFAGFPVGHHYPFGGWALLSGLIWLGASPVGATALLGWASVALAPLLLYCLATAAGARPAIACAGAAFLAWVSPYNGFVNSYETYFNVGLVSQLLGSLAAMLLSAAVLFGTRAWQAPVAAAATLLFHPQLAVAAAALLTVAVLASADRAAMGRGARAALALLCASLALYGQGVASLRIPFGWPPGMGWRHLGFHPSRLRWWLLDGDLFDLDRAPILTALTAAALLVAALLPRRPAARAALLTALVAVPLSVSGHYLVRTGEFGQTVLSVLQPLRVVAFLPLVAATLLVIALEEASALLTAVVRADRSLRSRLLTATPQILVGALLLLCLPARFAWSRPLAEHLAGLDARPCGKDTPAGYDRLRLRELVATLHGGRLWYPNGAKHPVPTCAIVDAFEHSARVPVALTGGVGAHAGAVFVAMGALEPSRDGSVARAEALGIRYLLLAARDPVTPGWERRATVGEIVLYEHPAATDRLGLGCVRERWSGSDRALRAELFRHLATAEGADQLLHPQDWIALETTTERTVTKSAVATDGCDPGGGRVTLEPREPGALAATVELAHAADIAFRSTAFPTWRVTVDGQAVPIETLAPGFFSVRLPPGRHRVLAVVSLLPGYWLALLAGAVGVAIAALPGAWLKRLARRR